MINLATKKTVPVVVDVRRALRNSELPGRPMAEVDVPIFDQGMSYREWLAGMIASSTMAIDRVPKNDVDVVAWARDVVRHADILIAALEAGERVEP